MTSKDRFFRRSNAGRNSRPRRVLLAATALVGLATIPSQGADGGLEPPKPPAPMATVDRWRLRPAQPIVAAPAVTGSIRSRPATAIPEERRHVRQVYPALVEAH